MFGPVRVLHAFMPLLERSSAPVVVNVQAAWARSALARTRRVAEFIFPVYSSSKAALNMLTVQYAAAFPNMRINAVDPGYTATDFNANRGTQTVEEGAEAIVRYAMLGPDGPTGGFFDRNGAEAW